MQKIKSREVEQGMMEVVEIHPEEGPLSTITFNPDEPLARMAKSRDWRADYRRHREEKPVTGKNLCAYLAFCEENKRPVEDGAVGLSLDLLLLTNRLGTPTFCEPPPKVETYGHPILLN